MGRKSTKTSEREMPLWGQPGSTELPPVDPKNPMRADLDYGDPDLTRAVLAAARQPGHPLNEEITKQGVSVYEAWMVIIKERWTCSQEGRPCRWDPIVEELRAGLPPKKQGRVYEHFNGVFEDQGHSEGIEHHGNGAGRSVNHNGRSRHERRRDEWD